jgi:hypothetical protein
VDNVEFIAGGRFASRGDKRAAGAAEPPRRSRPLVGKDAGAEKEVLAGPTARSTTNV